MRVVGALLGLAVAGLALGPGPATAADPERREAELLVLRAGLFDPVTLRAPEDAVRALEAILERVRAQEPVTRTIHEPMIPGTDLLLELDAAATEPACARHSGPPAVETGALGVPEVDGLTQRLGGAYRVWCGTGQRLVVVRIPRLLHVPTLLTLYRGLSAVRHVEEDAMLGGGSGIHAWRDGARWRLTFERGWGDCLAGCLSRQRLYFVAEPDGTVRKVGEWRRENGRETGVPPW